MHFIIQTRVEQNYQTVFNGFTKDLFMALKPPLMPLKLLRFDGCKKGDEVHVELMWGLKWTSLITSRALGTKEIFFIDEGLQLPFFLKSWQHQHRIINLENDNGGALIVDDITYQTPFFWLDYLLYPIMYLQFYYRKPVYKRYFKKLA